MPAERLNSKCPRFTHLERRPRDLVEMVPSKESQMRPRDIA